LPFGRFEIAGGAEGSAPVEFAAGKVAAFSRGFPEGAWFSARIGGAPQAVHRPVVE
jgi:hypothetical protein